MHTEPDQQNVSRRKALKYGAGLLGGASIVAWLGSGALARSMEERGYVVPDQLAQASIRVTPDEALKTLMEGNQRFVQAKTLNPHHDTVRVAQVAAGQAPFAAILSCADSRVVPEIAFDQGIGDLFVVRVAGNIAAVEDIASEEFAVGVLGSSLLMVLGHQNCGAVAAAVKGGELPGLIQSLVLAIKPAIESSEGMKGDRLTNAVKANVLLQMRRLETSSVIAAAVKEGKLKVVGAYYELETGKISLVS